MVRDNKPSHIVGFGLDGEDGHVRVTRAKNFHLVGGSDSTHKDMQEKCIQFNEKLQSKGKELRDLDREEFVELAAECKMNVIAPRRSK